MKYIHNLMLISVLAAIAAVGWATYNTLDDGQERTYVPSARTIDDASDTTNTQRMVDLIPTEKLKIPSTIDTAFLAYIREGDEGKLRSYSSYLPNLPEGQVYRAWYINDQAQSMSICDLKSEDGVQFRCDADAKATEDLKPVKYFITKQPSELDLPATQYLVEASQ